MKIIVIDLILTLMSPSHAVSHVDSLPLPS